MFKTIAIVVVVLIAGVLVFATTRPDSFRVERSVTIKAPPEKIYPYFDDFNRWAVWSPWEKLDPAMKRTFSGAPTGKGSVYAWQGNSKVGEGRMEILESSPSSKLLIKLDFIKPFEGHNTAEYTLTSSGDSTRVTWSMYGPSTFVTKLMGVFVSMDSMIGKDFEAGLANLKAAAEK
ncbi:MAG: SRPBCC family protein [Burkholderiaceae bacterium]